MSISPGWYIPTKSITRPRWVLAATETHVLYGTWGGYAPRVSRKDVRTLDQVGEGREGQRAMISSSPSPMRPSRTPANSYRELGIVASATGRSIFLVMMQ